MVNDHFKHRLKCSIIAYRRKLKTVRWRGLAYLHVWLRCVCHFFV